MNKPPFIRVLLVDDSSMVRSLLSEMLHASPDIRVIGEAANGEEAVRLAEQLKPDVICMDLDMPVMNGIEAIDAIMHQKAIPILVVSAEADAKKAYQALATGALDIISKPGLDHAETTNLLNKIRLLAGVSVITRLRRSGAALPVHVPASRSPAALQRNYRHLVAIACSTGGPQALAGLLPRLSRDFPAPVLISQHISDGFVEGMVQWLGTLSALPVKVAEQDEPLRAGQIYVSPSESHMTITDSDRIHLIGRQDSDIYRPCCNLLLESVAATHGPDSIGLIMTGMGRDGANGMLAIRNSGGRTLAQDEASSVIFGMNHEAIQLGAIEHVLALDAIPARLNQLVTGAP
ncbi:MAG: chemotaxis-specific protein-glutamate methyltransferase CheB [Thiopseudomonas sp.]|nr:chemotaxis-specific protein-glutamate methyltransferase CheB [Thiopseudomonas sp.]